MTSAQREFPVCIVAASGQDERVDRLLEGLEEEGVPANVRRSESGDATDLSARAAGNASFHVGLGISADGRVHLRHDRLHQDHLTDGLPPQADDLELRALGQNAGRIVKRLPLTLESGARWPLRIVTRPRQPQKESP